MKQASTRLFCPFFVLLFLLFSSTTMEGQLVISDPDQESYSLRPHAGLFLAGQKSLLYESISESNPSIQFQPITNYDENFGFSEDQFWIRFKLKNDTDRALNYILETGRPITDLITLYLKDSHNNIQVQNSGDGIPFWEKSVLHRKSVFEVAIGANETLEGYVHLKSDGEVVKLPLQLISQKRFLYQTYKEQIFYGLFYGILLLACIVYTFFYSAMRDITFIYYGLYVLFIALLQFSLDGLFHQYITPMGGLFSNRSVLASALLSLFFFGKYSKEFLDIETHCTFLGSTFKIMSRTILGAIVGLYLFPGLLASFYPIANIIGLVVLLQVVVSVVYLKKIRVAVDAYFIIGIGFLISGFVVFILNNLNIVSNSFFTENGAKFGIGLEIIFLSLSMSNRIRNLRMENEVNQRLALQRSEDMNEIKSSLISNISHELRTPLNLIMGMATSISETQQGDVKEKCKLILNSSENLLGHIDDILDFTVIEKGDHSLKEKAFNLIRTLDKVVDANKGRALNKNLDFIFTKSHDLPEMIVGDRAKLVQILDNLLDNAIKFTTEGHIKFHVSHSKAENDKVAINFSIIDTGIGISEDKMNTVFDAFTKKSFMDKREFYGLGLGLFIVKSYVDLQGGNMSLQNCSNGGAKCEVDLSFKVDEISLVTNLSPYKYNEEILGMRNILLVEDNKMNQQVISLIVKKWTNVCLRIANNGVEALGIMAEHVFDVVLMDLQMPIMDGFETTAIIRSGKLSNINALVPILVITADCTDNTRKEIFRLGANDYMTKPLNAPTLYNKIYPYLQLTETQSSNSTAF